MKIILVRHGESEGNANSLFIGSDGDYSLTELGISQAKNVIRIFRNKDIDDTYQIYSSPVQRALETAEIITGGINKTFTVDNRLREIDLGEFEGKSKETVSKKYSEVIRDFSEKPSICEIPGGESFIDVQQRVLSFIYDRLDEGKNIVIIAHDIVIRSFLVHAMSMSIDFIWSLSPDELMMGEQSKFEYGDKDVSLGSVSTVNYENGEFLVETIGLT